MRATPDLHTRYSPIPTLGRCETPSKLGGGIHNKRAPGPAEAQKRWAGPMAGDSICVIRGDATKGEAKEFLSHFTPSSATCDEGAANNCSLSRRGGVEGVEGWRGEGGGGSVWAWDYYLGELVCRL